MVLVGVISINDAFAQKIIRDDSTGGDCTLIGNWNSKQIIMCYEFIDSGLTVIDAKMKRIC